MPLITVILFFVFLGLLFALNGVLRNRKKLREVVCYGQEKFEIDLPHGATISKSIIERDIPAFSNLSAAEGFFQLITPYVGSLSVDKREEIHLKINDLKSDLKVNKEVYQYFIDEYKMYEGLNDEAAAEKWSQKK